MENRAMARGEEMGIAGFQLRQKHAQSPSSRSLNIVLRPGQRFDQDTDRANVCTISKHLRRSPLPCSHRKAGYAETDERASHKDRSRPRREETGAHGQNHQPAHAAADWDGASGA